METLEELQARHRKELRDLQSQTTQKKKQANKKTRKGVNDECDRLEAGLKQKQRGEIAALNGEIAEDNAPITELDNLTLQVDDIPPTNGAHADNCDGTNVIDSVNEDAGESSPPKKPNRQKARLARRAAEQEELARQAAEEAKTLPDLKQQERDRMLEYMKERGLRRKRSERMGIACTLQSQIN